MLIQECPRLRKLDPKYANLDWTRLHKCDYTNTTASLTRTVDSNGALGNLMTLVDSHLERITDAKPTYLT